jgi:N-methylhydantoinase A
VQAASGIYRIVAETMASAARAHATDRGVDFRGIPLLAFGGAGPVHACAVGELLQSAAVIFPPQASVLSAFGTLVTPVRLDLVRSALGQLAQVDWDDASAILGGMEQEGIAALMEAGCARADIVLQFGADLRYVGQQNEVGVVFPSDPRTHRDPAAIQALFETAYLAQYGVTPSHVPVELVSWRLTAKGRDITMAPQPADTAVEMAPGRRHIGLWDRDVPIYRRNALPAGFTLAGPAIIEERETTIVILPDWHASIDPIGCVVARKEPG